MKKINYLGIEENSKIDWSIIPLLKKPRARNWNKFGWRYWKERELNYTVDLNKLDAFLSNKRFI